MLDFVWLINASRWIMFDFDWLIHANRCVMHYIFYFVGVVKGEAFFSDKPTLCTLIASICLTACFCAFFSLFAVTINRYVCVCHHAHYHRLFSRNKNIAICVLIWISAFVCEMPNFLWDNGHIFDRKIQSCIWNRTGSYVYTMLVSNGFIWAPLFGMTGVYVKIFLHIRSSKAKIHYFGESVKRTVFNMRIWRATIRSSKTIFVVVIVFLILWSPYAVVIILDHDDTMSVGLHLYVTLFAHFHSSVNAIVYLATNKQCRSSMRRSLLCQQKEKIIKTMATPVPQPITNQSDQSRMKPLCVKNI